MTDFHRGKTQDLLHRAGQILSETEELNGPWLAGFPNLDAPGLLTRELRVDAVPIARVVARAHPAPIQVSLVTDEAVDGWYDGIRLELPVGEDGLTLGLHLLEAEDYTLLADAKPGIEAALACAAALLERMDTLAAAVTDNEEK